MDAYKILGNLSLAISSWTLYSTLSKSLIFLYQFFFIPNSTYLDNFIEYQSKPSTSELYKFCKIYNRMENFYILFKPFLRGGSLFFLRVYVTKETKNIRR